MNELISIIIPIYKVEKYLPKCLDSIIAQTYNNIEVILVDDGSPDRCALICDEYSGKDSRIKVIHKQNEGVNEARITGFKESHGEYITFVDPDDYVSPLYVERLYGTIRDENVAMSCVQWVYVKGGHKKKDRRTRFGLFDKDGIDDILKNDFLFNKKENTNAFNLGLCCKMIKREYLEGAMEQAKGLWIGEDLITNLYIIYRIPTIYILNEYLYYYVQHNSQSTRSCSLNSWRNQIGQWERIILIDKNNYLKDQLPYRILSMTKVFVRNIIDDGCKQFDFCSFWEKAISDNLFVERFINYPFSSLRIIDKIVVYLIKKKMFRMLYCLYKIKLPIARLRKREM